MPSPMRSVLFAFTLTMGGLIAATAGSSQPPAPAPAAAAAQPAPVTEATIVYLANVGSRYHNKDCVYLKKKSGKSVTILDAMKKGFAPCNQCKAPKLKRG